MHNAKTEVFIKFFFMWGRVESKWAIDMSKWKFSGILPENHTPLKAKSLFHAYLKGDENSSSAELRGFNKNRCWLIVISPGL